MNIKGDKKKKSSTTEDKEIRKVAAKSNGTGTTIVLCVILLLLFLSTLYITLVYIDTYYGITTGGNEEVIKIKTEYGNATITNNGSIEKTINSEFFEDDDKIVVENISTLELETAGNEDSVTLTYNVNYKINQNDFESNGVSSNSSPLLVKFSYSYDNENWTYINNALSTFSSNIMPLVNNNYDISGLTGNISVATNYELTATNESSSVIYWRSETIFQNTEDIDEDKVFNANFSISYTSSK